MTSRKKPFIKNEYYHIYNRGVEKRNIVLDEYDSKRFIQSMAQFNTKELIGSIYENSFRENNQLGRQASKLVEVVAFCLNPNHYHFILKQVSDRGIEKFMHRLGTGYSKYFNNKYDRSGSLFQGVFKSIHINSDSYMMHVSAYVNLNNKVHQLGRLASKLVRSSWNEYVGEIKDSYGIICYKKDVLNHFKNKKNYQKFALKSIKETTNKRKKEKEWGNLFLE